MTDTQTQAQRTPRQIPEALADVNADLTRRVVVDTAPMALGAEPQRHGVAQAAVPVGRRARARDQSGALCPGRRLPRARPSGGRGDPGARRGLLRRARGLPGRDLSDESSRQPPSPRSDTGCTLFVRLRQYPGADRPRLVEDTTDPAGWRPGLVEGLRVRPLYAQGGYPENVALVRWAPGTHFQRHTHWGGEEILVLEGEFADEHGRYPEGTWIRSPHLSQHTPFSETGCLIYVRVGGL